MGADKEKYYELINDLKSMQNVLNDQIKNKIGDECTRLENLVNAVKNVLDHVMKWSYDNLIDVEMSNLEGEESVE